MISFLTERQKRQREIILKMLIVDSNKRTNAKKKKSENLQDNELDLEEEVSYDGPAF